AGNTLAGGVTSNVISVSALSTAPRQRISSVPLLAPARFIPWNGRSAEESAVTISCAESPFRRRRTTPFCSGNFRFRSLGAVCQLLIPASPLISPPRNRALSALSVSFCGSTEYCELRLSARTFSIDERQSRSLSNSFPAVENCAADQVPFPLAC